MRKLVLLVSLVGLSIVGSGGPAHAGLPSCLAESPDTQVVGVSCVYPPGPPSVEIDDSTPPPGGDIILKAKGFCPGTTVDFFIDGVLVGSAVADSDGNATLPTTAPETKGDHVVLASSTSDEACTLQAQSGMNVGAQTPGTGSDSQTPLLAGIVAVAAGALLVAVARVRRRRPRPAAA